MAKTVLVQAGHEGGFRNSGSGRTASAGTAGTDTPERDMTPIVADAGAAALRAAGVTVIREDAYFDKKYIVDLAVFLHFDGSGTACASGASMGYPAGVPAGSNKPAADIWRAIYTPLFPFRWMRDNFTKNLSGYYGYARTSTRIAEVLLELAEITCPTQNAWVKPRLPWLGELVAHWAGEVIGVPVPHPGVWPPAPAADTSALQATVDQHTAALAGHTEALNQHQANLDFLLDHNHGTIVTKPERRS